MNKLTLLGVLATLALPASAALRPDRPTGQSSVYDPVSNTVTVSAKAPTHTEYDWETYEYVELTYITKATVERHISGTPWPDDALIGTVTEVSPGKVFTFVDSLIEADKKYEYRLRCYVDDTQGDNCFTWVYTGVIPGAPTAFSASTPDYKTARVDFTITAPAVSSTGEELASISAINVERYNLMEWHPVLTIENPNPGQTYSVSTEDVVIGENFSYRAYAINGTSGNGESIEYSLFVGEDIPGTPANLSYIVNGNDVLLSWEAPAKGSQNGSLNPDNLKYSVYVKMGEDGEFVAVANNLTATNYTVNLKLTELSVVEIAVGARNDMGECFKLATTPAIQMGPAATLPFRESFANATFEHKGWLTETSQDDEYYTYDAWETSATKSAYILDGDQTIVIEPQDSDGGLISAIFYAYSPEGQTESLITPPIDFSNAINPEISLWYYDVPLSEEGPNHLRICYQNESGEFTEVFDSNSLEVMDTHGWRKVTVALPLAGQASGKVRIDAIHGKWPSDLTIDNIRIEDNGEADLNDIMIESKAIEYYDLTGRRIVNPAKNQLLIKKHGTKIEKIVVR